MKSSGIECRRLLEHRTNVISGLHPNPHRVARFIHASFSWHWKVTGKEKKYRIRIPAWPVYPTSLWYNGMSQQAQCSRRWLNMPLFLIQMTTSMVMPLSISTTISSKQVSGEMNASIKYIAAPYVRYRPVRVSIETKRGLVGEEEARVQLATCMIAQYTRLSQLMTNQATGKLPCFPMLSVHGQRWFFMIACIHENGHIDLIKELLVGDTGSFAGVYQAIATIRRIAQWVHDDYRPCFEREILGKANGIQA